MEKGLQDAIHKTGIAVIYQSSWNDGWSFLSGIYNSPFLDMSCLCLLLDAASASGRRRRLRDRGLGGILGCTFLFDGKGGS